MTMPNFLIIGVPKAGTTSLYNYLRQHPQIYMPPEPYKEPHFFAFEGEKLDFRRPGDEEPWLHQYTITDLEAYQKLFQDVKDEVSIGEASILYLYLPKASKTIKHYIPNAKLIAILRHPVERAFSHFVHARRYGREWLTDFSQALQEEEKRIAQGYAPTWHYQQIGLYSEQLKRYFDIFEPSQIKVYLYNDWKSNPISFIQDIFRFLGVDDTFTPDMSRKHLVPDIVHKNNTLYNFLTNENPIKAALRKIIPAKLRQPMAAQVYRSNATQAPKLTPELRKQWAPLFREDIKQLEEFIQRDLSQWLI